jgi:hypothetical protein
MFSLYRKGGAMEHMEVTKRTLRQFGLMVGGIFLLISRGTFYLHIVLSRLLKYDFGTAELLDTREM